MLFIGGAMNTISACGFCAPTYNYYVFKITDCCSRYEYNMQIDERLRKEWCNYTGRNISYNDIQDYVKLRENDINTSSNPIVTSARAKSDTEMLNYMKLLATYLETVEPMSNEWHYADENETRAYKASLRTILAKAKAYHGTTLKDRYTLLQMRILLHLEDYNACEALYNSEYGRMQKGIFADMMRGYYAGALKRNNKREAAAAIFVELGDMQSARHCLNKTNNVKCLEAAVNADPNSPVVSFMLEEIMNSVQESYDFLQRNTEYQMDEEDWFSMTNVYNVNDQQRKQLMNLCDRMLSDSKVKNKQQWLSAKAYLHYFLKDYQTAYDEICKACKMSGSDASKDCARVLRMLFVAKLPDTQLVEKIYLEDFPWLVKKMRDVADAQKDTEVPEQLKSNKGEWCYLDNQWQRSAQRVLIHGLAAHYKDNGNTFMNLVVWRMVNTVEAGEDASRNTEYLAQDDYQHYSLLQNLSLNDLNAYYDFLFNQNHTKLQQYLIDNGLHTRVAYADYIGTRCLAMGRWQEAIKWMENIPMNYLSRQHIAVYAGMRDFTLDRWFNHIDVPESMEYEPYNLTRNKKIDYCRAVMATEQAYQSATGENRCYLAYELASLYFQASAKGDCWWLARYGVSPASEDVKQNPESTLDFAQKAYDTLADALRTSDKDLKAKALYARLYIPIDPVVTFTYNWQKDRYESKVNASSPQYKDLLSYAAFRAANRNLPSFFSTCDVLNDALRAKSN